MIYMKLILACLLAAAPFVYAAYMRSGKHSLPRVIKRLYEGMKKSDNFRNFFTLILLMVLVAYQYVDFHASTAIAEMLNNTGSCAGTATTISIYGKLMSSPYATIIAAGLSLPLFSYKLANRVLTELHNNQKLFLVVAMVAIALLLCVSVRFLVVSEVVAIILMAQLSIPTKPASASHLSVWHKHCGTHY